MNKDDKEKFTPYHSDLGGRMESDSDASQANDADAWMRQYGAGFIDEASKVRLTEKEHSSVRSALSAFVSQNPVREQSPTRPLPQRSEPKPFLLLNLLRPMPIAIIVVAIAVALGGGISVAAENALPGDVLYDVKVKVNEPLRTAFAFSSERKAEVETEIASRRLSEAEEVTARANLNADVRMRLEENFQAQADRVRDRIAELEAAGRTDAAANLSSALEVVLAAHERILAKLEADTDDTEEADEVTRLRVRVREHKNDAIELRLRVETRATAANAPEVETAAEGRINAAENKITEVKRFLDRLEARLGAEAVASARVRLAEAETLLADARTKLEADAHAEAFMLASGAHREAQQAKLLAEARANLNVEVEDDEDEENEDQDEDNDENEDQDENDDNDNDEQNSNQNRGSNNGRNGVEVRIDL